MQNNLAVKILAVLMCMVVLVTTFAACSDNDADPTGGNSEYTPEWVIQPEISAQLIQPLVHMVFNENTNHYDVRYADCYRIMVGSKYGIISSDGEMLVEAVYDDLFAIRDGDDFIGIIDEDGTETKTYIHSDTFETQSAYRSYNTQKYEYYWNAKTNSPMFVVSESNVVTELDFDPMLPEPIKGVTVSGRTYTPNGKYGLFVNGVNLTGMIYSNAGLYNDGIIAFESNGKWGYLDSEGRTVIPFIYDSIWGYNPLGGKYTPYESSNGCVSVCKDKKYGVVKNDGTEIVPLIFDDITPVVNGMAFAKTGGKWGVLKVFDSSEIPVSNNYPTFEQTSTTTTSTTELSEEDTTTTTTQTTTENALSGYYVVNTQSLYLRKGPGTEYGKLGLANKGDTFYVDVVVDGWGRISVDGEECWISLDYAVKS